MTMLSMTQRASLALLLLLLIGAVPLAAAELEEEIIHPSEVIFRNGQPYYDDGGDYIRLQTRQVDGEPVYFRTVRFDREQGYVDAQGESVARLQARPSDRDRGAGFVGAGYDERYVGDGGYRAIGGPLRLGASRNRPYGQIYYGNGLYGPDPYSSPHNRDARQRDIGPGYIGSCDLSGCREVHQFGFYDLR
ncbi:hypothetical protein ABFO19_20325 [Xanthomonas citri pv. glycines]|uniref:Secreted protein n=2 Tax=Xanthomonas TaxID=338 RepID=A0AAX0HXU6_XANCG|nr:MULTISPECIES: hypothetical protein [Xanthomonas]AOY61470.1 hypothetical protein BHE84_04400 [Xanthomonas citri pv. glycines str. 8ra]ARV24951.1 hypothetical protein A9D66_20670 [Xanthomonas citri pv. glycines str. 12-2]OEY89331.1 hypothetical protein BIY41_19870 [Xanthomonas citri pv. glycines]OOX02818.1 hypothetical protein Xgly_14715 [Xanthomonas citri pv. glycines]OOX12076.1 hypothetical protein Xkhy_17220 [Xanthomonas axonopodis pv. khayae]